MSFAHGFVIVRDDADYPVYLTRAGIWPPTGSEARTFKSYRDARDWMHKRSAGYWLGTPGGRARIISARAAGVER